MSPASRFFLRKRGLSTGGRRPVTPLQGWNGSALAGIMAVSRRSTGSPIVQRKLKSSRIERSLEDAGLPERMLERLRGDPEDELVVMDTERGLLLTRAGPDVEEFLEDVDAIRREYREALRKLAE